ncbi:hypothetical protein [Streptomyces sp. CBMA156]|uniref:hypothetical protein n=1 Tax=Streptomyces sp. CBMA156 TaxID=1930280 RepID=UPI001661BC3A|nr:hypothetical protein [Streptomyces sp. CBMA156]MBD0672268.1 hypothetical protein [Streptomyces sp. CBMA156]
MTIVAVLRPTRPSTDRGRPRSAFSTLFAVGRRLAASPLETPVLQALPALAADPADGGAGPAGTDTGTGTGGLRARWRAVTAPDGTTRLEARWHPDR